MNINRRRFLAAAGVPALAFGSIKTGAVGAADVIDRTVRLSGDGIGHTPAQYAALLTRLLDEKAMTPDSYSLGGIVEELEDRCARLLGKERAIFMPTGTLANHMAVRALAGGSSRVLVQEDSHFYLDEGDCAQTLSNLTLMPLAPGKATFTADEVQHVLDQTKGARVLSRVSVIAVETPVRRRQGEHFDAAELAKIVAIARREGIRLHLDGARIFLQAAYTGENVVDYAKPFDTVYVSLYKYFNAASGAILAGPRSVIDGMYHTPADVRRRAEHGVAVRARGAPLSRRLRRALQPRRQHLGGMDARAAAARRVRGRTDCVRHEPVPAAACGNAIRRHFRSGWRLAA